MKELISIPLVLLLVVMAITVNFSRTDVTAQTQQQAARKERSRSVFRGLHNVQDDKIPTKASREKNDLRIEVEEGMPVLTPGAEYSPKFMLRRSACDFDAVMTGVVKSQDSRLTEDETFIYTINNLQVTEVLKGDPTLTSKDIVVLRTGGSLNVNGKRVTAIAKSFKPLETGGVYLLFLTFLPETATYVADGPSYAIRGGEVLKMTAATLGPGTLSDQNADSLLAMVREASLSPCDGGIR